MKCYYDSEQTKYLHETDIQKDFKECQKLDSTWLESSFDNFLDSCLDIGTLEKTTLQITKGAAVYTGGGVYVILGKLSDGNYFVQSTCFEPSIFNGEITEHSESIDDLVCFDSEWCENHDVTSHYSESVLDELSREFCKALDKDRTLCIEEYKELQNYIPGEIENNMF